MTQACMGGWCTRRDHCANYHAATPDQTPSERLCPPGQDGAGPTNHMEQDMARIVFSKPERVAQLVALLKPSGTTTAEITEGLGLKSPARVSLLVNLAKGAGLLFACSGAIEGSRTSPGAYHFPTAQDRDAFQAVRGAQLREIRRVRWKSKDAAKKVKAAVVRPAQPSVSKADMRAAEREIAKQAARRAKESAAAEKQRAKAEAAKTQKRLKAETKAAGLIAKLKGTSSPAPAKPRGPAHLDGELDLSRAKVTKAPPMPDRWAAKHVPRVVSAGECRKWAEAAAA